MDLDVQIGGAAAARLLDWLAAWLLTFLLHGMLLLGGAWAAGRVIRSPGLRELLWKVAAVGALLTASVALLAGTRALPAAASPTAASDAASAPPARAPLRSSIGPLTLPPPPLPGAVVVGAWLATAVLGLCRLERGRRRFWRQVGRRRTLADPAVAATLRRLQDAARHPRVVHLTTAEGLGAPAAIGMAEICLPTDSLAALSPMQRESVLAHELGHLIRRDPLWRFTIEVLTALFVVQPLLRVARRELRECAEMLCDDFAVELTGRRRPLVESLAILAASLRPEHAPAVAFGEGNSPLVRRAARVLDARRAPSRRPRRAVAGALAGSILLASATSAPAVAPPHPAPPAPAEHLRLIRIELDPLRSPAADAGKGGEAVLHGRAAALRREVTLQRTAAGLSVRHYAENGVVVEPDASARRWIADVLHRHGSP